MHKGEERRGKRSARSSGQVAFITHGRVCLIVTGNFQKSLISLKRLQGGYQEWGVLLWGERNAGEFSARKHRKR